MEKLKINIKKMRNNAKIPIYGSDSAAGADFYAAIESEITINPHETVFIPTGLGFEIPIGYMGLIFARSSMACKQGLAPANKVGVVDADYRGEVMVALHNHSEQVKTVSPGERIAQFVFVPFYGADFIEVEELGNTARGTGGFGSTGRV